MKEWSFLFQMFLWEVMQSGTTIAFLASCGFSPSTKWNIQTWSQGFKRPTLQLGTMTKVPL